MKTELALFKVVVLCLIHILPLVSQSPDFQFESLNEQALLTDDCISTIFQDSRGFIWIGTEAGLNKYDGYTITDYLHDPEDPFSISHNFIRTIFEDPADSGRVLWIGTRGGGLNKYDQETDHFSAYQHDSEDSSSISHNVVECIFKDKSGIYWIGTQGGGLNRFDRHSRKFSSYQHDPNDVFSLGANDVFSICEDQFGFLWLGTGGCGLNKFDKKLKRFYHYRYHPDDPEGLPSDVVFAVHEDRTGVLWIGTKSGLRIYDRNEDRVIRPALMNNLADSLRYCNIWSIVEDKDGALWIATIGNGLFYINLQRDQVRFYKHIPGDPNSLAGNQISSVCSDRSGVIWVGTYCSYISRLVLYQKKFKCINIYGGSTSASDNCVASIAEDNRGFIWMGTQEGGLFKFDKKSQRCTSYQLDRYKMILCIDATKSGELWMARDVCLTQFNPRSGSFTNFLGRYRDYHPEMFSLVQQLTNQNRTLAAIQQVGNDQDISRDFELSRSTEILLVAMGEAVDGQLVDFGWLEKQDSTTAHFDDNITENKIKPIWQMAMEQTKNAGGAYQNRMQFALFDLTPGMYRLHYHSNDKHAYSNWVFEQPYHPELWGISVIQVNRKETDKIKSLMTREHFSSQVGAEGGDVFYVFVDCSDQVWCILRGVGIFQFDQINREFIPYEIHTDELIWREISLVYQDKSGNYWFGTSTRGLIQAVPITDTASKQIKYSYKHYQATSGNPTGISSNMIHAILEAQDGSIWIATDNGLNQFKPQTETFIHYQEQDGLPSKLIYAMLEDNSGNLWLSTNRGVSRFNLESKVFKNYTINDGLTGDIYHGTSFFKCKTGAMFFGGTNRFNMFHPDSIFENHNIPPVVITDFKLFNNVLI